MIKNRTFVLLTLLAVCLCSTPLFADPLVQGTASGAFYEGNTNKGTSVGILSYSGAEFGPTTNTVLNLGTFTLGRSLFAYYDHKFRLSLDFAAPTGIGGAEVTADVDGLVVAYLAGGVAIDFSQSPLTLSYSTGSGSGSFNLKLSDVKLSPGQTKNLYGTISNATFAAVPEPASVLLMATLFGGVAFGLRKRLAR